MDTVRPLSEGSFDNGLRGALATKDQVCDESEDRESERDREPERPPHAAKAGVLMDPQGDKEKRDVQAQ